MLPNVFAQPAREIRRGVKRKGVKSNPRVSRVARAALAHLGYLDIDTDGQNGPGLTSRMLTGLTSLYVSTCTVDMSSSYASPIPYHIAYHDHVKYTCVLYWAGEWKGGQA